MTVLVTGATGLIGNNVVRNFTETRPEQKIRCLVRPGADPRPLAGLRVEIVEGDITDANSVISACNGATAVIHCAALVHIGWTLQKDMQAINVDGTRNIARAARVAGARLVHVSSADTLRPARERQIPYVASKIAAEQAVQDEVARGLDAVVVRPSFVLGPNDWKPSSGSAFLAASTGWVPFAPRGELSLCDVRDVAIAISNALDSENLGGHYNLAGHNIRWLDALRLFARCGGQWPPVCRFDPLADRAVGLGGDLVGRLTGRESAVNSALMRLARSTTNLDDGQARSDLDYVNRPLEETLRDTWRWFSDSD